MDVSVGPAKSFSSLHFTSSLDTSEVGGGLTITTKDQDFAISKALYIQTSHSPAFAKGTFKQPTTNLTYVAAECKTNLDKTMFQEACATARDVEAAVTGARYYLLAEWLDMTPRGTAGTEINAVLILRKAHRLEASIRGKHSTREGRQLGRKAYLKYREDHPFRAEVFQRFISHIRTLLAPPKEGKVLARGYF